MSRYIHPHSLVETQGKEVDVPMSWREAKDELSHDEYYCAVMQTSKGIAALLVDGPDELAIVHVGECLAMYIINRALANKAR